MGVDSGHRGRVRRPLSLALGLATWLGATLLEAECAPSPSRILELEVSGCRPAALAVEEQVAGSRVWWLREYVISVARQAPGVVVRGVVSRGRRFEPPQTLGPWEAGGEGRELFYPSLDPEFCATFEEVDSILLVSHRPCCERVPPADVACLLELPQARPPTPLERRLAGIGAD